jgi:hypothetical protein
MFEILPKRLFSIAIILLMSIAAQSQIKGKITNNKSEPVPGAFIHLLNTNAETYSDASGNY